DAITRLLTSDIDVSPDLTVGNYMDILTSQSFARRVVQAMDEKTGEKPVNAIQTKSEENEPGSFLYPIKKALGFTARPLSSEEQSIVDLLDLMQTDHRGGQLIKVSVESEQPEKAFLLAQTVGEEFTEFHLETLQRRIDVLASFYQEQLERTYERLVEAEEALAAFKRSHKITAPTRTTTRLDGRLENLESQLIDMGSQRKLLEGRIDELDNQIENLQKNAPSLARIEMQLPRIEELKKRLVTLQSEFNTQSVLYTAKHPKIVGLRREIDSTVNELRGLAGGSAAQNDPDKTEAMVLWHDLYIEKLLNEVELNALRTKQEGLESLGNDYRKRILHDDADQGQQLLKLERDVQVAQDAYQGMLRTNEKVQGLEAEKALNINIVEPAERPLRPLPRKRGLKLAMGFFLGILVGIGFGYFREAMDRSVKTIEDIEQKIKLPFAGFVMDFHKQNKKPDKKDIGKKTSRNIFVLNDPHSDIAENFRALRTNLSFILNEMPDRKIIMVTSPGPGEGKSTVAINLASSFAIYGQKTILLDSDLYHPTSHTLLGFQKNIGLSDWLADESTPAGFQQSVQMNGSAMDYISAGSSRVTFQKLAVNSRLKTLLSELRESYEVVIIDAPPVIPVSDTAMIAPHTDMMLMVVASRRTQFDAANHAQAILQKANDAYIGVVLNRLDVKEAYGPGSYFGNYFQVYREKAAEKV
ncbi:MAG: GumC family protein, partial [bacterium]